MSFRNTTLMFVFKKDETGNKKEVLLAMKKRGFGKGKFNGPGGKQEENENIIDTAKRETEEEVGIKIENCENVGCLEFIFNDNPSWNQHCFVFKSFEFSKEPIESEEMKPCWFNVNEIPFDKMWEDDPLWFPKLLKDEPIYLQCVFETDADGNQILKCHKEIEKIPLPK